MDNKISVHEHPCASSIVCLMFICPCVCVCVTRQATEAGSLLATVFWSEKERAPSSPVHRYHQEKPEDERHKDRLMDITLTAERQMESSSQVMEAVFVASRPTA